MAYSSTSPSLNRILFLVFGIAFGLVALMMVYQGVKTNLDARSQAAQQAVEYKRWDFINDAEGWTGKGVNALTVSGGILSVTVGPGSVLTSPVGDISLPKGNKYIAFRIAATSDTTAPVLGDQSDCSISSDGTVICQGSSTSTGPGKVGGSPPGENISGGTGIVSPPYGTPSPCLPEPTCAPGATCVRPMYAPVGGWCPTGTPPSTTTSPMKRFITLLINYNNALNNGKGSAPRGLMSVLTVRVPVDGVMNDYSVPFPDIGALTISQLSIQVSDAVKGERLLFDTIKLVGPIVAEETPTSSTCTGQPNGKECETVCTQSMPPSCSSGTCQDGKCVHGTKLTPIPTCKPRPSCLDATPKCLIPETSDMCPPTTTSKTIPTVNVSPPPPKDCYYKQVQCVKAPCNPVLICPVTTTTTVIPQPTLTWDVCIKTNGSILLQTYPQICKTPDGRQVTQTVGTTTIPVTGTVNNGNAVPLESPDNVISNPHTQIDGVGTLTWQACVRALGSVILQTNPRICMTSDGRRVSESTIATQPFIIQWVNSAASFVRGLFGFIQ